jgi:hypothetical protein
MEAGSSGLMNNCFYTARRATDRASSARNYGRVICLKATFIRDQILIRLDNFETQSFARIDISNSFLAKSSFQREFDANAKLLR